MLKALAGLLEPVETAIAARNAAATHVHADETTWRVYEQVQDKTGHKWWLWVFTAPRGAVSYRLRSGQGWEEVSLDPMAYSGSKG